MNRTKLYTTVMLACMGGLLWVAIQYPQSIANPSHDQSVCMIKQVTHLPCPSCGTTRSVYELMNGHFISAIQVNPFGLFLVPLMLLSPLWICFDLLTGRDTFMRWYQRIEALVRQKRVAILLVTLVLANWIWNIVKGL
jgi:Protein of unknown function (DUF2752)